MERCCIHHDGGTYTDSALMPNRNTLPAMRTPLGLWIIFLLGFGGGWGAGHFFARDTATPQEERTVIAGKYAYISPVVDSELVRQSPTLADLKGRLDAYVDEAKSRGIATRIGLYYRDLNNGPWLGIDYDEEFYPASLVKLVVLMGTLRFSEVEEGLLERTAVYEGKFESLRNVEGDQETESLLIGERYTLAEMLYRMIVYSDNLSLWTLVGYWETDIPDELLQEVKDELGLVEGFSVEPFDLGTISPRRFSGFLRILYNANYLNKENSEFALSLLAQAEFREGLAFMLPKEIPVAAKFGILNPEKFVLQIENLDGKTLFHDCGIVYYPSRPYILCLMVESDGASGDRWQSTISEISALVFDYMEDTYGDVESRP
jgi:beta-lactamase class A